MILSGLSPEAHGTLLALHELQTIRLWDEAVGDELVQHGLAVVVDGVLRVTDEGMGVRPFESEPLN
jgi:hypothetical protein